MSLRGYGTSPAAKPLEKVSFADYIDDVRSVADDLGGSPVHHPVLIGHSLGGYTIQRYLEDRTAPAAVLVGSLPPSGVLEPGWADVAGRIHTWLQTRGLASPAQLSG